MANRGGGTSWVMGGDVPTARVQGGGGEVVGKLQGDEAVPVMLSRREEEEQRGRSACGRTAARS